MKSHFDWTSLIWSEYEELNLLYLKKIYLKKKFFFSNIIFLFVKETVSLSIQSRIDTRLIVHTQCVHCYSDWYLYIKQNKII